METVTLALAHLLCEKGILDAKELQDKVKELNSELAGKTIEEILFDLEHDFGTTRNCWGE